MAQRKRKAKSGAPKRGRSGTPYRIPAVKGTPPRQTDARGEKAKPTQRRVRRDSGITRLDSAWDPERADVLVDGVTQPGRWQVFQVSHPTNPYSSTWNDAGNDFSGLFDIANRYLEKLAARVTSLQPWLDELENPGDNVGRWITLQWLRNSDQVRTPLLGSSRWSVRSGPPETAPDGSVGTSKPTADRVALLIAGFCVAQNRASDSQAPVRGGIGLRVIAHVGPEEQDGTAAVRITGASSTLPSWSGNQADVPEYLRNNAKPKPGGVKTPKGAPKISVDSPLFVPFALRFARDFNVPPDSLTTLGISVPRVWHSNGGLVHMSALPVPDKTKDPDTLSEVLVGGYQHSGKFLHIRTISRRPLVASAAVATYVFKRDPPTRYGLAAIRASRPWRSSAQLKPYRDAVTLKNLSNGSAGHALLVDAGGDPDFYVTLSRFADADLLSSGTHAEDEPKEVPFNLDAPVRTNDFAAVNAYYHVSRLFQRMRRYGLLPEAYLRHVERPISVRYRGFVRPGGRDGREINAQVRWNTQATSKGTLDVSFALADLASSIRTSPLGVASDARWCWHEFSHVLLAGAIGELEFRFAHSCGDAMAAIACDPKSRLAAHGAWRYVSFPWVQIDRRHDRDPDDGWAWSGSLNQRELVLEPPGYDDRRGYWAEQILSTSLFRLYRCIGGDTEMLNGVGTKVPDIDARSAAAHYAMYLIMRAIDLMGSASVTPVQIPQTFAQALRDADIVASVYPMPSDYIPGTVHKVILASFADQGMDLAGITWTPDSAVPYGRVDVQIDSQRPEPVEHPYAPVNFIDLLWHAAADAILICKKGSRVVAKKPKATKPHDVYVKVRNRGPDDADAVTVTVYWADAATGAPPFPDPQLGPVLWGELDTITADIVGDGETTLGPFAWPAQPKGSYALLAVATCEADPANVDPTTGLPCATTPNPIPLLVACDNNLGYCEVEMS